LVWACTDPESYILSYPILSYAMHNRIYPHPIQGAVAPCAETTTPPPTHRQTDRHCPRIDILALSINDRVSSRLYTQTGQFYVLKKKKFRPQTPRLCKGRTRRGEGGISVQQSQHLCHCFPFNALLLLPAPLQRSGCYRCTCKHLSLCLLLSDQMPRRRPIPSVRLFVCSFVNARQAANDSHLLVLHLVLSFFLSACCLLILAPLSPSFNQSLSCSVV
jgi:hypothetical protein